MASLSKRGNGWSLRFLDHRRRRKTIALPATTERQAKDAQRFIEDIVSAKKLGVSPSVESRAWLKKISPAFKAKLAGVGLVEHSAEVAGIPETLGEYIDQYLARRTDIKRDTRKHWKIARLHLVNHFGSSRRLDAITPAMAKDFDRYLRMDARCAGEGGLSSNTAAALLAVAKRFFNDAVERGVLESNPFNVKGISLRQTPNASRQFFIDTAMARAVLDACPNQDWRTIFALARYGGLRTPSETLQLRWQDINWEKGTMLIRSPKTEKYEGREQRVVPLFSELRPVLEAAFDAAPEGAVYVVGYRSITTPMRERFIEIIRRAGFAPWPRLFHNLRSSRQTELSERFPAHVACSWLGNSEDVARAHYLQVTEAHIAAAVGAHSGAPALSGEKPHEAAAVKGELRETAASRAKHPHRESWEDSTNVAETQGITQFSAERSTNDANVRDSGQDFSLPDALVERWPTLPAHVRSLLLTIAERCPTEGQAAALIAELAKEAPDA